MVREEKEMRLLYVSWYIRATLSFSLLSATCCPECLGVLCAGRTHVERRQAADTVEAV